MPNTNLICFSFLQDRPTVQTGGTLRQVPFWLGFMDPWIAVVHLWTTEKPTPNSHFNTKLTCSQDDWKEYHKIPCDLMIYIIVIYRGRRQLKHPTEIQIYPKPPKGECFFSKFGGFWASQNGPTSPPSLNKKNENYGWWKESCTSWGR